MKNGNLLLNKLLNYLSLEQIIGFMDDDIRDNFLSELVYENEKIFTNCGFIFSEQKFDSYNPTLREVYCEITELFCDLANNLEESYTGYSLIKLHELEGSIRKENDTSDEYFVTNEGLLADVEVLTNMYKINQKNEKIKGRATK